MTTREEIISKLKSHSSETLQSGGRKLSGEM